MTIFILRPLGRILGNLLNGQPRIGQIFDAFRTYMNANIVPN